MFTRGVGLGPVWGCGLPVLYHPISSNCKITFSSNQKVVLFILIYQYNLGIRHYLYEAMKTFYKKNNWSPKEQQKVTHKYFENILRTCLVFLPPPAEILFIIENIRTSAEGFVSCTFSPKQNTLKTVHTLSGKVVQIAVTSSLELP